MSARWLRCSYLNQTQAQLSQTQSAINSGMKVASAKDNGAVYAIAQNMRGNVAGYTAVTDSLNRGMSSVDVAMSAGSVDLRPARRNEDQGSGRPPTPRSIPRAARR